MKVWPRALGGNSGQQKGYEHVEKEEINIEVSSDEELNEYDDEVHS